MPRHSTLAPLLFIGFLGACILKPLDPPPPGSEPSAPPQAPPQTPPDSPPKAPPSPPEPRAPSVLQALPSDRFQAQGSLALGSLTPASPAERAFFERLEGHPGWPVDVSIHVSWSSNVTAELILLDLEDSNEIPVALEPLDRGLRATPLEPLSPGRSYAYAVISDALAPREDAAPELLAAFEQLDPTAGSIVWVDTFVTSAETIPTFDLQTGRMEVPNDLLLIDGRPSAGLAFAADHGRAILDYDGFSTTAPAFIGFSKPVAAVDLALFDARGQAPNALPFAIEPDVLAIEPQLPLGGGELHAVVAWSDEVQPNLQSIALLVEAPLTERSRSTVRMLSSELARRLEGPRAALAPIRAAITSSLGSTSELDALLPFTTLSPSTLLSQRRAQLSDLPVTVSDVEAGAPGLLGLGLTMPNVETVVRGTFQSLGVDAIDFVLTIPKDVDPQTALPVVLTGHGLSASADALNVWADGLAEAGFAAFAIDLPHHGERATGGPLTSSLDFINLDPLSATRDNFLQAMVDMSQAVRVIQQAPWDSITGGYSLEGDDIVYMGQSLGSIVGAGLAGIEPSIESYALNVPGASLVDLIALSEQPILQNMFQADLQARGIAQDTADYHRYLASAKWVMDICDPVNLVPREQQRRTLLQMVPDDQVIPNQSTRVLAQVLGTPIELFEPPLLGHAFFANPTSPEARRALTQIIEFFEAR